MRHIFLLVWFIHLLLIKFQFVEPQVKSRTKINLLNSPIYLFIRFTGSKRRL
jgi:hypothetical protein